MGDEPLLVTAPQDAASSSADPTIDTQRTLPDEPPNNASHYLLTPGSMPSRLLDHLLHLAIRSSPPTIFKLASCRSLWHRILRLPDFTQLAKAHESRLLADLHAFYRYRWAPLGKSRASLLHPALEWSQMDRNLRRIVCEWGAKQLKQIEAAHDPTTQIGTVDRAWHTLQRHNRTSIQRSDVDVELSDSDADEELRIDVCRPAYQMISALEYHQRTLRSLLGDLQKAQRHVPDSDDNRPIKIGEKVDIVILAWQLAGLLWALGLGASAVKGDWSSSVDFCWTVAVLPGAIGFVLMALTMLIPAVVLYVFQSSLEAIRSKYLFLPTPSPLWPRVPGADRIIGEACLGTCCDTRVYCY